MADPGTLTMLETTSIDLSVTGLPEQVLLGRANDPGLVRLIDKSYSSVAFLPAVFLK